MKIGHVALWTTRLEEVKEFYATRFGGRYGEKYVNPSKGFESYMLCFGVGGAGLEIMRRTDISAAAPQVYTGFCHIAFEVESAEKVRELTEKFRSEGVTILGEPRLTGDGFYESVVADPDGNPVEIVAPGR